ncbi:transposase [Aliarcobacter skirrowii]|uniref:transposase n=1 Tax=Aliarcobacter skirrowii TaxID=28200 RepID=UPI00384C6425
MPPRYTDEFKIDAIKQVLENGYGVTETAERLGIHHDSLRNWIKRYQTPESLNKLNITDNANLEIKRLQKELKRVTEERDILKKAAAYFVNNPN